MKKKSTKRNKTANSRGGRADKTKTIKLRCSPTQNKKGFTCLEDDTLHKLRDMWNARNPSNPIMSNDSQKIWKTLNSELKNVCDKESCWLKQEFVGGRLNKELKTSFAPEIPSEWKTNPREWLTNIDILKVMKQFEKEYKCFEFIGPAPIDFDKKEPDGRCVMDELCYFSIDDQIKRGKTKIGIIFNTDPHDKPGAHWISLFMNIKKGTIFYFDSAGVKIPNEIKRLVDRVIKQGNSLKPKVKFAFDQNYPVEHQYGDTECGVYSLYFIAHLLQDRHTEKYFKTHILSDRYIEQFRNIYFNKSL